VVSINPKEKIFYSEKDFKLVRGEDYFQIHLNGEFVQISPEKYQELIHSSYSGNGLKERLIKLKPSLEKVTKENDFPFHKFLGAMIKTNPLYTNN
jgi:hypothetical protein